MKHFLISFFIGIATFALLIGAFVGFFALDTEISCSYYKGTEWDCTSEEFIRDYWPTYREKLETLCEEHGIEADTHITKNGDCITVLLYNEQATVDVTLNGGNLYGTYSVNLYYYTEKGASSAYTEMLPYVSFINDFTRFAAYDTKADEHPNHFLRLYEEALASDSSPAASYSYHFDKMVGYIGYKTHTADKDNYHYMGMRDFDADERPCISFCFKGLLCTQKKP